MNYGHFDLENKEYVITRPDTPSAWANYLGSPEYGAIISNNAGGYSFVKSGANGRVIRYRFNAVPNDSPADMYISRTLRTMISGRLRGRPYASPSTATRASAVTVQPTLSSPQSTRR